MSAAVITRGLTKRYGSRRGLESLDLEIAEGEVFGYLGPNGAGKSTTIRLLLDLIRPTSGSIEVLGQDPHSGGRQLRQQIGYLPGTLIVGERQRVSHLLTYFANLRGGVPRERIIDLAQRLDLDLNAEVRTLSKGNKQKVGIVQAFMHDPRLLLLDEPTSGLDPLLQRVFLELVNESKAGGTTILMSSHVLSEVQHTAARIGVIKEGKLVALESVEEIRRKSMRRVTAIFPEGFSPLDYQRFPGANSVEVDANKVSFNFVGRPAPLLARLAGDGVEDVLVEEPDLESIFFHFYERGE